MSFSLSGSASKSSSKTSSNSVTTKDVPAWLQTQIQGQAGKINELGGVDPASYVAGADPLQVKAGAMAAGLNGNPAAFGAARDATSGVLGKDAFQFGDAPKVEAASGLDNLSSWYNPFEKQVIDASAADFDHNAAMGRAQRDLDMAGQGGFAGSGAALTTTLGDDASSRARASLLSGLRAQGFNTAAGFSSQDADRTQQARMTNAGFQQQQERSRFDASQAHDATQLSGAGQLAGLATAEDANTRANTDALFNTGAGLREIEGQKLTAPLDLNAWVNQQFGTLNGEMFVGQTTNATGTSKGKSMTIGASGGYG